MILFTGLVIILLLFINALYVSAEFSSVSVHRSRIQKLAQEGNTLAKNLLPIIQDRRKLDLYVSTSKIGITLSSLILGAYGQAKIAMELSPVLEKWGKLQSIAAHSASALVVLLGLSILQMLFGEFLPKTIALQYPTQLAIYTVVPMRWSQTIFYWFIKILNGSGLFILKLLQIPQGGPMHIHSPEEIELLIAESRDGGLLEEDEHQRLHQALRLSMRSARHLMVPRPHMSTIDIDTPLDKALWQIADSPYTRLPVYRNSIDDIVGILHVKDLVTKYLEHGKINSLEEVVRPALFIPETMRADRLMNILRQEHSQQAIVVDEFGGVAGIISLEDLLAEVLGDIFDEFKQSEIKPEVQPDGRIKIPGIMHLNEVEEWIGIPWCGEATTVGGYVIERLGRLPEVGEKLAINGVEVEILKVKKNTITSILATKLQTDKEAS